MMNSMHYLFHLLAYYIAWIICILLAAQGHGLLGALIVILLVLLQIYWQFKLQKNTKGLFYFILILTGVGSLIDTFLIWNGIIILASNPFSPYFTSPWMINLWISFAVFMFSTLSYLFSHYFFTAALSFFGFSIAYALGVKMGAAFFPYGYLTSLLIGAIWAILLPLSLYSYLWILKSDD